MLQMKGSRNAGAGFAISVCLVPVNVTTGECNCVFVWGCVMCACIRECCLIMLSFAKIIHWQ